MRRTGRQTSAPAAARIARRVAVVGRRLKARESHGIPRLDLRLQSPVAQALLKTTAIVLPWVELLCGLLLLAGFWSQTALLIVTGLLVGFVIATGQAWVRGIDIACGCFNLKIFGLTDHFPGSAAFSNPFRSRSSAISC